MKAQRDLSTLADLFRDASLRQLDDFGLSLKEALQVEAALRDRAPSPKQPDFRAQVFRAAERTNQRYGQWMPQQWLEIFVGEMMKEPE